MSKGNKGFDSGRPSPIGPTSNSEGVGMRILGFLITPIIWVLTSVFMTVVIFMIMKVEQGESWDSLMGWWWSLMNLSITYTIVFPSILCTGIIILLFKPWSK